MTKNNNLSLLVIEDEAVLLYALNAGLSLKGYQIFTAANCDRAYDILKKNIIDVIIIDSVIGNQTSIEFIEKIKIDKKTKKIPIILLLDNESDLNLIHLEKMGIKNKLIKAKHTLVELADILDDMVSRFV